MNKDEALKLAKSWFEANTYGNEAVEVYEAIEQALAAQPAPVQEPVWIRPDHLQKAQKAPFLCRVEPHKRDDFVPLYTTPCAAQRQWVGLTDAEMQAIWDRYAHMEMMRAIEAKLREKNT